MKNVFWWALNTIQQCNYNLQLHFAILHSLHPILLDTGPYSWFYTCQNVMQSVLGTIIQSLLLSHIFKYKLYFHPTDFSGVMLCTPAGGLVLFFALFISFFFFFFLFCFVLFCLLWNYKWVWRLIISAHPFSFILWQQLLVQSQHS